MNSPAAHPHYHSVRYYIIMSTLIIGGILLVLLINNGGEYSLTSAIVKSIEGGSDGSVLSEEELLEQINEDEKEETSFFTYPSKDKTDSLLTKNKKTKTLGVNEVDIVISSNKVPSFRNEANFGDVELRLNDITTSITVNGDKLEVYDLEDKTKTFKMKDCVGKINFDGEGVLMEVVASKFEINDVALSSDKEIKVSFAGYQSYEYFSMSDVKVDDFTIPSGNGELQVAEKLTYKLEEDEANIGTFSGSIIVDFESDSDSVLTLNGIAKGISLSGEELKLDLR